MAANLPAELTSFVGRREELTQLRTRLAAHRLVTLTGEGGSGKSRLAAQLCRQIDGELGDVWWVDLGPVTDPDLVVRAVADALGIRTESESDSLSGVVGRLQTTGGLVCLDTCEHLLEAVADLTHRLLVSCERVVVLATSRESLGVAGEATYRVPSLTPSDASLLFADRAALSDPTFAPADVAADVEAICGRVDGLPLAIELAAAWVQALTPAQIATGLGDSLQLLGGGPKTAIPRHRALVASIDWSHDLLGEDERAVLRRLAVFAGEFTAAAAIAVAGDHDVDVLLIVRRLVDKSFVVTRRHGDQVRFRLLDTVRHYALDKLQTWNEVASTRDRHLAHYLELAVRAEGGSNVDQDRWRLLLDAERGNIHSALQWALTPARATSGRAFAAAMSQHWLIRSQAHEGLGFLDRALELDPMDRSALQARLHLGRALLAMVAGRVQEVAESATVAEEIAAEVDDPALGARATAMHAYSHFFTDTARCQANARRAEAVAAASGDGFTRDWAAALDGYTLTRRDRHAAAVAVARPAYERSAGRHDRFCGSFLLGIEMLAQVNTGNVRGAAVLGDEVMELAAPLGDYFAYGSNATNVAHAVGMAGDLARAKAIMDPIVQDLDRSTDVDVIAYMLTIGFLHLWSGQPEAALPWFERGVQQHSTYEWTATRCLVPLAETLRRLGQTDEAAAVAARGAAAAVEVDSPAVLAAAYDEQGYQMVSDDPARAFDLHHRALAIRREHDLATYFPHSLEALGSIAAGTGSPGAAVRTLAAADAARNRIGYPRPPLDRPEHDNAMASLRDELGAETFRQQWTEGGALSLDQAIAAVTRGRGTRDRPNAGWSSLSPTELSVAAMVADGLPNPEIAKRMFISRSTVKTHLAHIYTKLGTSSRTELAAITAAARDAAGSP